jgi:hypothetical protein
MWRFQSMQTKMQVLFKFGVVAICILEFYWRSLDDRDFSSQLLRLRSFTKRTKKQENFLNPSRRYLSKSRSASPV